MAGKVDAAELLAEAELDVVDTAEVNVVVMLTSAAARAGDAVTDIMPDAIARRL